MLPKAATRFLPLLELLDQHNVDFVLVGGVAATLAGAPIITFDLDILFDPTDENIERLLRVLARANARYRDPAGRLILPDAGKLKTFRLSLLDTDYGQFDVLRIIGNGITFEAAAANSAWTELGSVRARVLDLAMVIESKEQANRPKDVAVLPVLRSTLEERRKLAAKAEAEASGT